MIDLLLPLLLVTSCYRAATMPDMVLQHEVAWREPCGPSCVIVGPSMTGQGGQKANQQIVIKSSILAIFA